MPERTCSAEDCTEPVKSLGMCQSHYTKHWRIYGPRPKPTLAERFWSKVDQRGPNECWPWIAWCNPDGYGWFQIGARAHLAHRVAYELDVGPIPDGLQIDHTCHTNDRACEGGRACLHRACSNPSHLEPVSARENGRRGQSGIQHRRKTHCPQGHPYDDANTYHYRGERHCKACKRVRLREWKARRRG